MENPADAWSPGLVRNGVDVYKKALSAAGGRELEALTQPGAHGTVCAALYTAPPYDLQVPPLPVSRLSVNLTPARVSGGIDGARQASYEAQRYSMFLVPAGAPTVWRKESPSRHLNIYFHAAAFDDAGDAGPVLDRQLPVFNTQVAGVRLLADQLAAELDGAGVMQLEAADSLARLILVRLARQLRAPGRQVNPLTDAIIARLREHVLAHLGERILVADLAREAGLSPNRFAQAFSEHTRQSPYRFVLGLRLERATQLLASSSLSLVEVSHECGFSSQQHLCHAMRSQLGTTPSQYRRQHRLPGGAAGRGEAGS